MPFKKGKSGNPSGKKKGTKNKKPAGLVDEILKIAAELDKKNKGLRNYAFQSPKDFIEKVLMKVIPRNIELEIDGEIQQIIKIINYGKAKSK